MEKLGSMGAGALCGGVIGLFLLWVFEIRSAEAVAIVILGSCAFGAVAALLLTTKAFLRAFELVLRIINPP